MIFVFLCFVLFLRVLYELSPSFKSWEVREVRTWRVG